MDIYQMKYVVALAKHRNFTLAAESCFISQSSLSQHISKLEKELGVKLFDRTTRTIRITEAGRAYVEMARAGALTEDMYTCFFTSESSMAAYRRFFEVLLDSTGPVLWHCTGGKDRAGLATVMLLSLLGVPEQTALEDFSLANEVNRTEILYKVSQAKRYTEDPEELGTVADLAGVSPACMARVFDLAWAENIPMCTFIR